MTSNLIRKYSNILAEASVSDSPNTVGYYLWHPQKGKISELESRPRYVWEHAEDLGVTPNDGYYCVRVDRDGTGNEEHSIMDFSSKAPEYGAVIGKVPNPQKVN